MTEPALELALDYSLPAHSQILIRAGLLEHLGSRLPDLLANRHAFVVTDQQVLAARGDRLLSLFRAHAAAVTLHAIPPGETSKSLEQLAELWQAMAAANLTREALVVAWGGGVVGDLAGCAAATFGRGLAWLQVPTTLMAQVDSSLGGKVGINLPAGKNLVGSVWQPAQVWIDPDCLASLPPREYRSGLAEVVKYAVLLGQPFANQLRELAPQLNARDPAALAKVIAGCCQGKLQLVAADPLDQTGRRALLNYGHTIGHALEQVAGYGRLTHGEAVAIGMNLAALLAVRLGHVAASFVAEQRELLDRFELPTQSPPLPVPELLAAIGRDKKALRSSWRFVLPRGWGQLELSAVPAAEVAAILTTGA